MALAAGLHGVHRLDLSRPGRFEQFGVNFKTRILVDSDVIRPYKKISGKIDVETRFPIKHKGLLIQFEGLCILRYTSKLDNRTSFHQGRNCLVANAKEENGYSRSPVHQVILPESCYVINPGETNTWSFSLEMPGDKPLPPPFKNSLGSLVYRLVVYMKSSSVYVEVGEKVMRFNGHHNLLYDVEALKPISLENFYKKSTFSRKKLVEALFSVDAPGCLPGESIQFIFYARNPKCIPLQVTIQLLQEIKFDATGRRDSPKKRFVIVGTMEKEDLEPQPELTWIDGLHVRENLEPTFNAHSMYNITYSIQYKLKILDHGIIKGGAPVYIGTTRDPVQVLRGNANALDVPFVGLGRRGSTSSTHSTRSHNSATTTYSLPPAYSQLSSRIPSVETLPPTYDEVEFLENTQGGVTIEVPDIALSPVEDQENEHLIGEEEADESDSN